MAVEVTRPEDALLLADLALGVFAAWAIGKAGQTFRLYRAEHEAPEPLQDAGGHVRIVGEVYDWSQAGGGL